MKRYEYLLIDADGTFLDFGKTEDQALIGLMDHMKWEDRDLLKEIYSRVNREAWISYEKGNITSVEINDYRFMELYQNLPKKKQTPLSAKEMGDFYFEELKKGDFLIEGSKEFFEYLKNKYTLILATNGLAEVQRARLEKAGLTDYFQSMAISQELGLNKPKKEYFIKALEPYNYNKNKVLMIGDSLPSDIGGANNFEIDSCWFNPGKWKNESPAIPTYEIHTLGEIQEIL
jgi:2-haloacid dehalogenase